LVLGSYAIHHPHNHTRDKLTITFNNSLMRSNTLPIGKLPALPGMYGRDPAPLRQEWLASLSLE